MQVPTTHYSGGYGSLHYKFSQIHLPCRQFHHAINLTSSNLQKFAPILHKSWHKRKFSSNKRFTLIALTDLPKFSGLVSMCFCIPKLRPAHVIASQEEVGRALFFRMVNTNLSKQTTYSLATITYYTQQDTVLAEKAHNKFGPWKFKGHYIQNQYMHKCYGYVCTYICT